MWAVARNRSRTALLALVGLTLAACGTAPAPSDETTGTTSTDADSTTTVGPTTTATQPVSGLDLTGVTWVTFGLDGLRTDMGSLLWDSTGSFDKAVARDRLGGLVFVEGSDLWWFEVGTAEPVRVAGDVPSRLVGVTPERVAVLGYGEPWTFVHITSGSPRQGHVASPVTVEADRAETWTAANGWSASLVAPELAPADEGTPTDVVSPARLEIRDDAGMLVADVVVGTDEETWVRIHDFDGQRLIVSRGPIEPAMPEETFMLIDLGCAGCTEVFGAAAASATLVGPDASWSGPLDFSEASLP